MTPRTRDSSMDCSVHSGWSRVAPGWLRPHVPGGSQWTGSVRSTVMPPRRCRSTVCGAPIAAQAAACRAGLPVTRAASPERDSPASMRASAAARRRSRRKVAALNRRRSNSDEPGRHGAWPAITQENCPCGGGATVCKRGPSRSSSRRAAHQSGSAGGAAATVGMGATRRAAGRPGGAARSSAADRPASGPADRDMCCAAVAVAATTAHTTAARAAAPAARVAALAAKAEQLATAAFAKPVAASAAMRAARAAEYAGAAGPTRVARIK